MTHDEAIKAVAERAGLEGWRKITLDAAGTDAMIFFPAGVEDAMRGLHDLLDRRMVEQAGDLSALRLSQRVRHLVAARLMVAEDFRPALRRAVPLAAHPRFGVLFTRLLACTVDRIWRVAGDRSADANWYSKRAILAGVYASTMLRWLNDTSQDHQDSLDFLDRRLAGVARFGKAKHRIAERLAAIGPVRG